MNTTVIYPGVAHGDWVRCNNCRTLMLLPHGADKCPECHVTGNLDWALIDSEEASVEELEQRCEQLIYIKRELKPQSYLSMETIKCEFPDYHKQLARGRMKHTDFAMAVARIRELEYKELRAAIEAHGGEYSWEDADEMPCIAANIDCAFPYPADVRIQEIHIGENGRLVLVGQDKDYGEAVDLEWSDVFPGQLSFLIDYIPGTEDVGTVKGTYNDITLE